MSLEIVTVKPHAHLLHPCDAHRKEALLAFLCARHEGAKILVVSNTDLNLPEGVTLCSHAQLGTYEPYGFDVLISMDVPEDPAVYIARLAYTKTWAHLIADDKEQLHLYAIETLLKRTLKKEVIEGFEPNSLIEAQKTAQMAQAKKERKIIQQRIVDEEARAALRKPKRKPFHHDTLGEKTPHDPNKRAPKSVTVRAKKIPKD